MGGGWGEGGFWVWLRCEGKGCVLVVCCYFTPVNGMIGVWQSRARLGKAKPLQSPEKAPPPKPSQPSAAARPTPTKPPQAPFETHRGHQLLHAALLVGDGPERRPRGLDKLVVVHGAGSGQHHAGTPGVGVEGVFVSLAGKFGFFCGRSRPQRANKEPTTAQQVKRTKKVKHTRTPPPHL